MTQNSWNSQYPAVKGQLVAGTGSAQAQTLTVGTNGQVLTADSTQTTGLSWTTLGTANAVVVQQQRVSNASFTTISTVIPFDDTIPQITEGDQVLSLAITPTSSSSVLVVEFTGMLGNNTAGGTTSVALFRDAGVNAVYSTEGTSANAAWPVSTPFIYYTSSASASTTTFTVRVGPDTAQTASINGTGSARRFGGTTELVLTITEYANVVIPQTNIVQQVRNTTSATHSVNSSCDAVTTPTTGNTASIFTLAITPTSATNILLLELIGCGAVSSGGGFTGGPVIFNGSTPLFASGMIGLAPAGSRNGTSFALSASMVSGTTSTITFDFRFATGGANWDVNNLFGGFGTTTLTITEVTP